jgi:hypothetical protein
VWQSVAIAYKYGFLSAQISDLYNNACIDTIMISPSFLVLLGFLHFINAQGLDVEMLADLDPLPSASIPVIYVSSKGAVPATVLTSTYSQAAVLASISSILDDPSETLAMLMSDSNFRTRYSPTHFPSLLKMGLHLTSTSF